MLNKLEGLADPPATRPPPCGIDGCRAVGGNGETLPYREHKAGVFEEFIVRDHGCEILARVQVFNSITPLWRNSVFVARIRGICQFEVSKRPRAGWVGQGEGSYSKWIAKGILCNQSNRPIFHRIDGGSVSHAEAGVIICAATTINRGST
jgi:hypothetical protein